MDMEDKLLTQVSKILGKSEIELGFHYSLMDIIAELVEVIESNERQ